MDRLKQEMGEKFNRDAMEDLHSNMDRLKREKTVARAVADCNLHSNMDRLKLEC